MSSLSGEVSESAEGARLLSEYTGLNLYRGFKSLPLRHLKRTERFILGMDRFFVIRFAKEAIMQGTDLIEALKTALHKNTNRELAPYLGITEARISQLYQQEKNLSARQIVSLIRHTHEVAQREARENAFKTAIKPLVEFYPIDLTLSRRAANWELFDANSSTYAAGLRDSLEEHHGIYVFFDSRGKSIYVGKAKRQSLWMEMNSALNRKRKNLQRMMLVSHPTRNQQFIPSCDKPRQVVECNVFLSDIATYFSAYSVADEFIDIAESLLIRCFPNNLLNKKMEQAVFSND